MNIQQLLHDKAEKNIRKYDDQELKRMACSHFEYVMHEDGNNYCKACHICEADVPVQEYWGINMEAEMKGGL